MRREAKGRGRPQREFFECPNCGADVPVGAKACRECGSDATTGWQSAEEIDYQGAELPEGYAVDADHPGRVVEHKRSPLAVAVVVLLVVAFAVWAIVR